MLNVVSLQVAKFAKAAVSAGVPRIPTEFDASDVLRLTQDDNVLRLNDAVVFGPVAGPQIRKMLASMGQPKVPQTFAELFGLYRLGVKINAISPGIDEDVPQTVQELTLRRADQDVPGLSVLLGCLKEGRMEDASQWHLENHSMRYWADWYKSAFSGSDQGV